MGNFDLHQVPLYQDNYSYLLKDKKSGTVVSIDPGQAEPVLGAASALGWLVSDIWITHHHWDHIGGLEEVKATTGALVTGPAAEYKKIGRLDRLVHGGESFPWGEEDIQVLDLSGHTLGQIGFLVPRAVDNRAPIIFPADSLFAMGCGRLFEGTPAMMWRSLRYFCEESTHFPPESLICGTHECSIGNARFALSVEPKNRALQFRAEACEKRRAEQKATVPFTLAKEWETNPFLRPHSVEIRTNLINRAIIAEEASDEEVFTSLRGMKDCFWGGGSSSKNK